MVIREWRGCADPSCAHAYPEHFRNSVLPHLKRLPGFLGAELCRREKGDKLEFLVLTRWKSLDAVHAFAGANMGTAVLEPGAVAALTEYDTDVRHYEVVERFQS
jgi:heme-degrading monooxygenase HmoA